MIDTEKYQPARQNMKFVARSLHSIGNKLHIMAPQADIFGINQFTHPENIYIFGLLNIENRVQQQESVIYTQSAITKVHIIYILYKKID
jgi:hypothetical protein